jgi:CRP-like cAMP-binding protein
MTTTATTLLTALPTEQRDRLLRFAREVDIPRGTRLFEEGQRADRFWIVRSGCVTLDLHVPGRQAAVIERLCSGQLVGWSWMFAPFIWHLGAEAGTLVHAYEFDATAVRLTCQDDPTLGAAVALWVAQVLAHRLQTSRTRLLDLYGPYGSGPMP